VAEAEAGLVHAEAANEKASADHERFKALYEKDKVVPRDSYERMAVAYKQASAGLAHARAVVELARARKEQAAAALRIAEKQLSDSLARAPFDGVVSERMLEPGEYAGGGTKVMTLKSAGDYEARGHLAAAYLPRVGVNATRAVVSVGGRDIGDFPVTLCSPTIDFATRTFEIRVALTNDAPVTDGMACGIAVVLDDRKGLGVPSRAIGLRNGTSVVFVVEGGLARQVPVIRGIVDNGDTELVSADELKGKSVVIEGQSFLNDKSPVRTE
jgi:RND family efflux transporter MFP subunit